MPLALPSVPAVRPQFVFNLFASFIFIILASTHSTFILTGVEVNLNAVVVAKDESEEAVVDGFGPGPPPFPSVPLSTASSSSTSVSLTTSLLRSFSTSRSSFCYLLL